ncbi:MAG: OmpH family outer membrane protein [Thermodesulfobacteriota bacterium]|nr:OmpH family outer membrane protein [Thermodesulfobacteriota bacterium]
MKRFVIAVLMIFCLGSVAGAADLKIGFVDLQKALSLSAAGQAAKAKMDNELQSVQAEVLKRQGDLTALQESLKKQLALLSVEAKQEKEREFQQQVKDYQRFTKDQKEAMRSKEMMFTKQILRDLSAQVMILSKDKGVAMMFEKGQLVYAVDSIDFTDELINAYDAEYNDSHK